MNWKRTLVLWAGMAFILSPLHAQTYPIIEAEDYDDMSGVQTENAGSTVGFIDGGDWLMYEQINFNPGPGSMILNIATTGSNGSLHLHLDTPDGRLLGSFYPTSTGSWVAFQNQQLNIDTVTGTHDLYLIAEGGAGVCNIDYFTFSAIRLTEPNWVLEWSDEFNGTSVNEDHWRVVNHGNPDNGEWQFYTPREENVVVSDGTLKLIAREETYTGQGPWMSSPQTRQYTSGKLESEGRMYFQYGRIEASMKLPRGKGTWPAFWMLGENIFDPNVGWPKCGEIDIMEHGQDFDHLGAALHTGASNHYIGNQRTGTYHIDDYDTEFHTYGVEWSADALKFYVDNDFYFTVTKEEAGSSDDEWPFDQGFYLILNHAVGGAWGGAPDPSLYPHTVEVDWVRVYKDQPLALPQAQEENHGFSFYPNPSEGSIEISTELYGPNSSLKVLDSTGRTLLSSPMLSNTMQLDLGNLAKGYYTLSLYRDNSPVQSSPLVLD